MLPQSNTSGWSWLLFPKRAKRQTSQKIVLRKSILFKFTNASR